jgi:hypothetical protein
MAASITIAAAPLPPANGGTYAGPFEPSVWGDFFINYTPPSSQACTYIYIHIYIYLIKGPFFLSAS